MIRSLLSITAFLFLVHVPLTAQNCASAPVALDFLEVNGIRALLSTGGDLWWDGRDGFYRILEPDFPTLNEPTGAFAGGLWLLGRDPGGSVKGSAQQYGRSTGRFDYTTGPLDAGGLPDVDCGRWDKFWEVTAEDLNNFFNNFNPNNPDLSAIPENIAGWPGVGNPLFQENNGF
ncbi:MAG: hypothetical protein AAF597_07505, partial [Bacteroidota bacterium]